MNCNELMEALTVLCVFSLCDVCMPVLLVSGFVLQHGGKYSGSALFAARRAVKYKQYIKREGGKTRGPAEPSAAEEEEEVEYVAETPSRMARRTAEDETEDELLKPIWRYQPIYKAHRTLCYRLGRPPTLRQWLEAANVTREELEDAQKACRERLDELVSENKAYVGQIAKSFKSFGWQREELLLAGVEGFKRGLMEYTRQPGYNYMTFCTQHIRAAIGKSVTRSMEQRLPDWLLRVKNKIETTVRELAQKDTTGALSDQTIADALGVPLALYDKLVDKVNSYTAVKPPPVKFTAWRPGGAFGSEQELMDYLQQEKAVQRFKQSQERVAEEVEELEKPIVHVDRLLTREELNVYDAMTRRKMTAEDLATLHQLPAQYIQQVHDRAAAKIAQAWQELENEIPEEEREEQQPRQAQVVAPLQEDLNFMRRRKKRWLSLVA